MTVQAANILPAKIAEAAQTTQYVSSQGVTLIDKFTVTNYSGSPATFSANLVTASDTAGNQNLILKTRTIQPNECYLCPELTGHYLNLNGFISTLAGTAASLTIRASGRIVTT